MSIFVFLLGFLWISLQNSLYHATTTATSGLKFKEKKKSRPSPPFKKIINESTMPAFTASQYTALNSYTLFKGVQRVK